MIVKSKSLRPEFDSGLVWSLVAAGREVLFGKQDLPKAASIETARRVKQVRLWLEFTVFRPLAS